MPCVPGSGSVELAVVGGAAHRGMQRAPGESRVQPRIVPADTTTRYLQRARRGQCNNEYIYEFVVWNPVGPQCVFHIADGVKYAWPWRETAPGELTFYPHPAYAGGPIGYWHGPECRAERLYEEPTTTWSFPEGSHADDRGAVPADGTDQGPPQAAVADEGVGAPPG